MSNIYLAAPVFGADETKKEHVQAVYAALIAGRHCVYRPDWLRIPNAWNMPLEEWARCVFTHDLIALDSADTVVVLDYGRHGTCGTAWETGYAFAKGKNIVNVLMPGVTEQSLMMRCGCTKCVMYESFVQTGNIRPLDYKQAMRNEPLWLT